MMLYPINGSAIPIWIALPFMHLAPDLRHAPHSWGMALRFTFEGERHFVVMRLVAQGFAE
ncbi:hypothetical protein D3C76_1743510 [compost metagenome]